MRSNKDSILIIGCCFPEKQLDELIKEKKIIQVAANVHCWKIAKGLKDHFNKVIILNEYKVTPYKESKILIHKEYNYNEDNIEFCNYRFVNLPIIKKVSKCRSIARRLDSYNYKTIIVYSLHSPYLIPAYMHKIKHPRVKIVVVVPDLPMLMGKRGKVRRLLKSVDDSLIRYMLRKCDGFILLTKYMREYGCISQKPSIVVEGISDDTDVSGSSIIQSTTKYILYAGSVDKDYRLPEFIEAYIKADIDSELWICGDGDFADKLKEIERKNSKIEYLGLVDRKRLKELQAGASLLVNPRYKEGDFEKYSFPSKTMEYFQAGVPIMMEKLPGVPDDYFSYIIEVKDHKWIEALREYDKMSRAEMDIISAGEKSFVRKKSVAIQGKRMADFIGSVMDEV